MKLPYQQLTKQLAQSLDNIYMVSGEEILLVNEASSAIRNKALSEGFDEIQKISVTAKFKWDDFLTQVSMPSLFSPKRLIELDLTTAKPGQAGSKALINYCENMPKNVCLLIICQKLDAAASRAKWVKAIEQHGTYIQIWPISTEQLLPWLKQRMQTHSLSADQHGLRLLADKVEGNLLAAAQEIEKLQLLHVTAKDEKLYQLTPEQIAHAITNNCRYNVFDLIDQALAGHKQQLLKVLYNLQGEGQEPILILWAIVRELRNLAKMSLALQQGDNMASVLKAHQVWRNRQAITQQALQRHQTMYWQKLLALASNIDQMIKGAQPGNSSLALRQLLLRMAA